MSIWIGLSLLLSLALGAFLVAPLFEPLAMVDGPAAQPADARARLLDSRERLLRAIKDLELDQTMGKVSREDFERGKGELALELAQVIEELRRYG